jgi:hypothetical protein
VLGRSGPRRDVDGVERSVFSALLRQIAQAVLDGANLEEIEAEIIDPAPVDADHRSALRRCAEALGERRRTATVKDEITLASEASPARVAS